MARRANSHALRIKSPVTFCYKMSTYQKVFFFFAEWTLKGLGSRKPWHFFDRNGYAQTPPDWRLDGEEVPLDLLLGDGSLSDLCRLDAAMRNEAQCACHDEPHRRSPAKLGE